MKNNMRRSPRQSDYGASWISYSDMMAALLVIFVMVLIYSIYQYYIMIDIKSAEIAEKKTLLAQQQATLDSQSEKIKSQLTAINTQELALESQKATLDAQSKVLAQKETDLQDAQTKLTAAQTEIDTQKATLSAQETELASLSSELAAKQSTLDAQSLTLSTLQSNLDKQSKDLQTQSAKITAQEQELKNQQIRINELIGVRTSIIRELALGLQENKVKATVDNRTGDIVLASTVFFDTGRYQLKTEGQRLLSDFLPVYLNILLQDKYREYVGEIIIEGHTDTVGTYINNLELSQDRALSVAKAALNLPALSQEQREFLKGILTAKGKSYSTPITNEDGTINKEQSRRVEFKFRLKDSEMINELSNILNGETP
ncbi:MAG: OmpA family protein [Eubacteriales bacterium]|nr:OmpA family protein [Eubacteriales bacterium]